MDWKYHYNSEQLTMSTFPTEQWNNSGGKPWKENPAYVGLPADTNVVPPKPDLNWKSDNKTISHPDIVINYALPVLWNDFVVVSATASYSNNESSSSVNLKLIPNKTQHERKLTYVSKYVDCAKINNDYNEYSANVTVDKSPNLYTGTPFTKFQTSILRSAFEDSYGYPKNITRSNEEIILSPDGLELFKKPFYSRIGNPASFNFDGFNFGGIITSWKISNGREGFFYECVISDASEILKDVSIIVGGYKGASGFFNVLNCIGCFEAIFTKNNVPYNINYFVDRPYGGGFNYATNDTIKGMMLADIKKSLTYLLNPVTSLPAPKTYGGPIIFGHKESFVQYSLDLSLFNYVSQDYFYEGSNGVSSLYDLFGKIASDAGGDLIIALEGTKIIPKFIDRKTKTEENAIARFIQSQSASGKVVNSSFGYDLIPQNVSGSMVVGAAKESFYETNAIRPVYGSYPNGTPILGIPARIELQTTFMSVYYDVEYVLIPVPFNVTNILGSTYYLASTLEFQMINSSAETWERYLRIFKYNLWYLLYGYGYESKEAAQFFQDRNPTSGGSLTKLYAEKFGFASAAPADYSSSLFNTISAYAKNWGKLFAVKLPDKMTEYGFRYDPSLPTPQDFTQDGLEGRRKIQYEVLNNAFVEEGSFPLGMSKYTAGHFLDESSNIPVVVEYVDNGMFIPFVGKIYYTGNDFLGSLIPDNITGQNRLFSKCSVVEKTTFIDAPDSFVFIDSNAVGDNYSWSTYFHGVNAGAYDDIYMGSYNALPYINGYFAVISVDGIPQYGIPPSTRIGTSLLIMSNLLAPTLESAIQQHSEKSQNEPLKGPYMLPNRIAIPLKYTSDNYVFRSDRESLGCVARFKSNSVIAKVDIEIDESFSPSSFGGVGVFQKATEAKLKSVSSLRQGETGTITVVGSPKGSLGDYFLFDGTFSKNSILNNKFGPILSGISFNFGASSPTTTYEFKSFAPRFGIVPKDYIERIKKTGLESQKKKIASVKKESANFWAATNPGTYTSRFWDRQPPHNALYFRMFISPGAAPRMMSSSRTEEETIPDIVNKIDSAAVVSWDNFLRPYTIRLVNSRSQLGLNQGQIVPDLILSGGINSPSNIDIWPKIQDPVMNGAQIPYKALINTLNSRVLNPCPIECYTEFAITKKGTTSQSVTNLRSFGKNEGGYYTGMSLKGPVVVSGNGIDKHDFSSVGSFLNLTSVKAGPIDLTWDNYRGLWSSRDTELVEILDFDIAIGMPGYIIKVRPVNFLSNKIFYAYHNAIPAPQIKMSQARFMNNSVKSTTMHGIPLSTAKKGFPQNVYWALDPEPPTIGTIQTNGSILDGHGRTFLPLLDFYPSVGAVGNTVILYFYMGDWARYQVITSSAGEIKMGATSVLISKNNSGAISTLKEGTIIAHNPFKKDIKAGTMVLYTVANNFAGFLVNLIINADCD